MSASENQIVAYQPNEPVWVDMKGWSRSSLMYMRQFAEAWTRREIVQAPLGQLPWYHHLASLKNIVRLTFAARMLAHPSGSAFAESSLRNASHFFGAFRRWVRRSSPVFLNQSARQRWTIRNTARARKWLACLVQRLEYDIICV